MAGLNTSEVKSAFVAESTIGTTPSTPGWTYLDTIAHMRATPTLSEATSVYRSGARTDTAVQGIEVAGNLSGPLIYGNYDVWLASLLQGSWSTDVLKDGQTASTFTIENDVDAGAGGTRTLLRYEGVQAVNGSIMAEAGQDVSLSLDLMGISSIDGSTSEVASSTYSNPSNTAPMTAGVDVGSITASGYTLDCFQRVEIQFAFEGREGQPKVGTTDLCGITLGAPRPIINARVYVEGNFQALYDAARSSHSAFAVSVPLGSVSGSKYTVDFPACEFAKADLDLTGKDAFVDLQILPLYSSSDSCTIKVTRAVS